MIKIFMVLHYPLTVQINCQKNEYLSDDTGFASDKTEIALSFGFTYPYV